MRPQIAMCQIICLQRGEDQYLVWSIICRNHSRLGENQSSLPLVYFHFIDPSLTDIGFCSLQWASWIEALLSYDIPSII
jgi:hypothetical protein